MYNTFNRLFGCYIKSASLNTVVKVKSTDSTDTLKPNPNGDKPLEPLDRAQKTVKNEYRKPQNH